MSLRKLGRAKESKKKKKQEIQQAFSRSLHNVCKRETEEEKCLDELKAIRVLHPSLGN